jgi:hypothetical protein
MVLRQVLDRVPQLALTMATNKKSGKKYKPKYVLVNPMGFVMENMTSVSSHSSFMLSLKIKNHGALTMLTTGKGTQWDIEILIAMVNMTEAFARIGFGQDYSDVVRDGIQALRSVGRRGVETGSFVMKSAEMNALNTIMELHDAQMEMVTLKDMDKAIALVKEEYRQRKMTPIVEKT